MLRKLSFALLALTLLACVSAPPAGKDAGPAPTVAVGQEPEPVAPHYPPVGRKMGAIAEGQTSTGSISAIPLVATDDAGGVAVAVTSTAAGTLPTGGATAAKQDTGNTSLASIDTKTPSKGTAVMTGSTPVTIATNDTLGLTLATGAKQDTGNTSLSTISSTLTTVSGDIILLKQPTRTAAVTISDSTDLTSTCTKGIWVGTAGNVAVKGAGDSSAVTLKNVPSGTFVPGALSRVMSTNTTAADIVCFYGP